MARRESIVEFVIHYKSGKVYTNSSELWFA